MVYCSLITIMTTEICFIWSLLSLQTTRLGAFGLMGCKLCCLTVKKSCLSSGSLRRVWINSRKVTVTSSSFEASICKTFIKIMFLIKPWLSGLRVKHRCAEYENLIYVTNTHIYQGGVRRFNLVQVRHDKLRFHKVFISTQFKNILLRGRKKVEKPFVHSTVY